MSNFKELITDLLRTGRSTHPTERKVAPVARKTLEPDVTPKSTVNRVHNHSHRTRTTTVSFDPAIFREQLLASGAPEGACDHKWEWSHGVKRCWLCHFPAPVDRRDRSTTWQSKVYGGRK